MISVDLHRRIVAQVHWRDGAGIVLSKNLVTLNFAVFVKLCPISEINAAINVVDYPQHNAISLHKDDVHGKLVPPNSVEDAVTFDGSNPVDWVDVSVAIYH